MADNVIKRFAFFKTLNGFKSAEKGTDYDDNTLIFIKDSKLIKTHNTDFQTLPDGAKEGDVLVFDGEKFVWKSASDIQIDGKDLSEVINGLVTYENLTSTLEEYAKLTDLPDVSNYFDGASYNAVSKEIEFKHGETVKATIDATPFIKDGMIDSVEISGGKLVITWNTDAGKEVTEIAITEIFNAENYYTKVEVNNLLEDYAKTSEVDSKLEDYYTKEEVDKAIEEIDVTDQLEDYALKSEVEETYAKKNDVYTKAEIDEMFSWYEGD